MPALADITEAIKAAKAGPSRARLLGSTPRFKVRVGPAAEASLRCETTDHRLPIFIDGCVVETTTEFNGYEVVEL